MTIRLISVALQEQMERLNSLAAGGGERNDAVDHCLAGIDRLSHEVKDASSYIPAYDQRTYSEACPTVIVSEATQLTIPGNQSPFREATGHPSDLQSTQEIRLQDTQKRISHLHLRRRRTRRLTASARPNRHLRHIQHKLLLRTDAARQTVSRRAKRAGSRALFTKQYSSSKRRHLRHKRRRATTVLLCSDKHSHQQPQCDQHHRTGICLARNEFWHSHEPHELHCRSQRAGAHIPILSTVP